jgi:hypothetical protein
MTTKQQRQTEESAVKDVVQQLTTLSGRYSISIVKRACNRFVSAINDKRKAEREIQVLEKKLSIAKNRLK